MNWPLICSFIYLFIYKCSKFAHCYCASFSSKASSPHFFDFATSLISSLKMQDVHLTFHCETSAEKQNRRSSVRKKALWGKKKNQTLLHLGIFGGGLSHRQKNSPRHNKVWGQRLGLWNCPCSMFSSAAATAELHFCSYLCHIRVHSHPDCYLWGRNHLDPVSNSVTMPGLSAKWWRVRSRAAL